MCITGFWYKPNDIYRLILVSNRDEFYERMSMPAHWWATGILAGKDLQAGGTWLGVGPQRFATLTNYRDMKRHRSDRPTRGLLVSRYLEGQENTDTFRRNLVEQGADYNPFNILFYDNEAGRMYYYTNMEGSVRELGPGFYTLSNHTLNTPWPKTERLKELLLHQDPSRPAPHQLFKILNDEEQAPVASLPKTGVPEELELLLSSIFITSETYGTRFQSVFILEENGLFTLYERALDHKKGTWEYQSFQSDFNDLMIT